MRPAAPGLAPRLPVGLSALGADRVEIEQVVGILGHEPDQPPGVRRPLCGRVQAVHLDGASLARTGPLQGPQQR